MTIHYHGTPITPVSALHELAGRFFCVSYERPADVTRAHQVGQGVMLDNGAFSVWRRGAIADWPGYYAWADPWLSYPNTWAVIPDVIEADETAQDTLVAQWPHGTRGAPVWHMHEIVSRLLRLLQKWPRVCIGSSGLYRTVMSEAWKRRMDIVWNAIAHHFRRTPQVHMLRGLNTVGERWPFASVDSTDIARNHNRRKNPGAMAARWDAIQCNGVWIPQPVQQDMLS